MIIDALPSEVVLSGVRVPVRTNFRVWMQIEQLFSDQEVTSKERVLGALDLCYVHADQLTDIEEAMNGLLWFYRCGQPRDKRLERKAQAVGIKRIYDYDQDAELFYAGFMEQYHIDLTSCELHWWQFKALFHGLNDDVLLIKVMGYRNMSLSDLDGKTRQRIAQLQAQYRLRNGLSEEEKEAMLYDPNYADFS